MKIKILLILFLISIFSGIRAQKIMDVRRYTSADGLNVGSKIEFDVQGYGWILPIARNFNHLQRFDGNKFELVKDLGTTLTNAWYSGSSALLKDSSGYMWLATDTGVFYFRDGVVNKHFTSIDGLPSDSVVSLFNFRKGVFVLTKKGIAFITKNENTFHISLVDTLDFKKIPWKWEERNSSIYLDFSGNGVNDMWFAYRLRKDSLNPVNFNHYTVDESNHITINRFKISIPFIKFEAWDNSVLARTNNGIEILYPDGSYEKMDPNIKRYVGKDSKQRSLFIIKKGDAYFLVRDSVAEITEFGKSNNYFEYKSALNTNAQGSITFGENLLIFEGVKKKILLVEDDTLISIEENYPEFGRLLDENYNYNIPGDGQLWAFKWGSIGALSIRLRKEIFVHRDTKNINGSKILGFSQDHRKLYLLNNNMNSDETYMISELNTLSKEFSLSKSKAGLTDFDFDRNMGFDLFSNPLSSGEFYWWPEHKVSGDKLCFYHSKDKGFQEDIEITILMNAFPVFDHCEIDNSWIFITDSTAIFLNKNNDLKAIELPVRIKPQWVIKLTGYNFIVAQDSSVYGYYNGQFVDISKSMNEMPRSVYYLNNDGKTVIFNLKKNKCWYKDGLIGYPDTITYPQLSNTKRIEIDNLGRIILHYKLNDSGEQTGFCLITEDSYQFLPRNDNEDLMGIVLDYINDKDENFIYYTSSAIYKWNNKFDVFYKFYNYADIKGYVWKALVLDQYLYFSGWGNSLIQIDLSKVHLSIPKTLIRVIRIDDEPIETAESIEIAYNQQLSLEVFCSEATFYPQVEYQYRFDESEKWSRPITFNRFDFETLLPGKHKLHIRALGENKVWGHPLVLEIVVRPPWYKTSIAYVGFAFLTILLFWLGIRLNTRRLKSKNLNLQRLVDEKTFELRTKNDEIMDSINYARRIQEAILPSIKLVKQYLTESFILYKPKDIVAGDFYWFDVQGDEVYFAAADCTGHGVPGAMVSVVCANALNRAVNEMNITEPAKILDKVRELVVQTFEKSEDEVKDGMDISFCKLNLKTRKLVYAGAHNPLYRITPLVETKENILSNETHMLIEYKGDKQPIGKWAFEKPFLQQEIQLLKGDTIYLSTDGYADQFGGEHGKKFMYKPFKQLFLSVHQQSMDEQKSILSDAFEKWKNRVEQVDDVCVIGVRL